MRKKQLNASDAFKRHMGNFSVDNSMIPAYNKTVVYQNSSFIICRIKKAKGSSAKRFYCFLTSGVHLVLSTSVRRRRNIPPSAEHLFRTCVHLDVQEAMDSFLQSSLSFLAVLSRI